MTFVEVTMAILAGFVLGVVGYVVYLGIGDYMDKRGKR
jgi:capsular polysaccharide biosynthesis protein